MAAPTNSSLSSFISSNQYATEVVGADALVAGFLAIGTGPGSYTAPTFTGVNGAASTDPGSLFGWLIYARTLASSSTTSTPKGTTSDSYIVYTNPSALVGDLNLLGNVGVCGATACLVGASSDGVTYGFFLDNSSTLTPLNAGIDFLHAITFLAYGGTLVVAGTTAAFDTYENVTGKKVDLLMGTTANGSLATWLNSKQYTFGVFPTIGSGSSTPVGAGYTMADYGTFLASQTAVATGTTFSTRVFNIMGLHTFVNKDTSSLIPGSKMITTSIPAVADVAGFFTRGKKSGKLYSNIGGNATGFVLNDNITGTISWDNTSLKSKLRNNRVNFFIKPSTVAFLAQDLVGATASSASPIAIERLSASELKLAIDKDAQAVGLNYLYKINNAATRAAVTAAVKASIGKYNANLDPTKTQVICNNTNNTDGAQTLNITIVVKPILSADNIVINTSLTS